MELKTFENTPITYSELLQLLPEYRAPKNKMQELEKDGDIIRLKRGYYIVSPKVSGKMIVPELIANHLHAPSYISLMTALRYYGLIPERVTSIRSITSARAAKFSNITGNYFYTHVAKAYYPLGITIGTIDNTNFLIATPEKALCDLIVTTPNLRLRYMSELRQYLEEDIRLDMEAFRQMNPDFFIECAKVSQKKTAIRNLAKLLKS